MRGHINDHVFSHQMWDAATQRTVETSRAEGARFKELKQLESGQYQKGTSG